MEKVQQTQWDYSASKDENLSTLTEAINDLGKNFNELKEFIIVMNALQRAKEYSNRN